MDIAEGIRSVLFVSLEDFTKEIIPLIQKSGNRVSCKQGDISVLVSNEKFIVEFKESFPEDIKTVRQVLTKVLNNEVPMLLSQRTTVPGHQFPMKIIRKVYLSKGTYGILRLDLFVKVVYL